MKTWIILLPLALLTRAGAAETPELPVVPPRDKEVAMALSAAPEHLRAAAGVSALDRRGFVQVRAGSNGFICIVNRDHPRSLKPTCYDREGAATILPKVLRVGELADEGDAARADPRRD